MLPRKTVTFRLPEESTRPESTNPFQPLENTIENFPPPDDPEPDDTDRDSESELILEDPLEPEDDFALDLMSALYKKRKSQLGMIPVEINGTSVTALIDSGAQGIFVSKSVAKKLKGVRYDPSSSVSIRFVTGEIVRCMVYWRGNSAENQDTNGKLGSKPYRERYHPGMDEQCGRSGWLAGSRSERCLTFSPFQHRQTAS